VAVGVVCGVCLSSVGFGVVSGIIVAGVAGVFGVDLDEFGAGVEGALLPPTLFFGAGRSEYKLNIQAFPLLLPVLFVARDKGILPRTLQKATKAERRRGDEQVWLVGAWRWYDSFSPCLYAD